jgi:type III pantothenate kinase
MLFVIDIGNTETVIGLFIKEDLKSHWRLASRIHRTADEYWIFIKAWCDEEGYSLSGLEGVVISSVVPTLTELFSKIVRIRLGLEPLIVQADSDTGLRNCYDIPSMVGADRICNAVAGYTRFGGPLIVVDFGTATTFDVVSGKGDYLGGIISLGLKGASQELHRIAAKLPRVELVFPPRIVGTRTETSIQSGIMWGTVALVDGMINKIQKEMNWSDVQVVATGGVAETVVEKSERIKIVEPFLTLYGMKIIYQRIGRNGK